MKNLVKVKVKATALFLIGFLATSLLTSCQDDGLSVDDNLDDAQLIAAIQNSALLSDIAPDKLPASSKTVIEKDYSENYTNKVSMAPELGYEVSLRIKKGGDVGNLWKTYFNLNGRELKASEDKGKEYSGKGSKDNNGKECFELVLPVSFIMPDEAIISVENEQGWQAIKEWYEANADSEEKPALQYPVEISFDKDNKTIASEKEMAQLHAFCSGDKGGKGGKGDKGDKEKSCFELAYPITYQMPDGTPIVIENKEGWAGIKNWYVSNPDSKEKPTLQYPLHIVMQDGTKLTANSQQEIKEIKENCPTGG